MRIATPRVSEHDRRSLTMTRQLLLELWEVLTQRVMTRVGCRGHPDHDALIRRRDRDSDIPEVARVESDGE